jgi:hypothetical protein
MCDRPATYSSEKERAIALWADLVNDIVARAAPESQPMMLYEDIALMIERCVRAYLRKHLYL